MKTLKEKYFLFGFTYLVVKKVARMHSWKHFKESIGLHANGRRSSFVVKYYLSLTFSDISLGMILYLNEYHKSFSKIVEAWVAKR